MIKSKYEDLVDILKLQDGDELEFNIFQEGGALVERKGDKYHLYEIPLYGGEPGYMRSFDVEELGDLVDMAHSWT